MGSLVSLLPPEEHPCYVLLSVRQIVKCVNLLWGRCICSSGPHRFLKSF